MKRLIASLLFSTILKDYYVHFKHEYERGKNDGFERGYRKGFDDGSIEGHKRALYKSETKGMHIDSMGIVLFENDKVESDQYTMKF